jgi:hypothetical protein
VPIEERHGVTVYAKEQDEMVVRAEVLKRCRAMLVLGGSVSSRKEVELARAQRIPVVPLAASQGLARDVWLEGIDVAGLPELTSLVRRDWELLPNDDLDIAVDAALRLLMAAMYVS